jgi:hypothetical protein
MKYVRAIIRTTALTAMCALLASCGNESAPAATGTNEPSKPAVSTPASALTVTASAKRPDQAVLKAGADAMMALSTGKHEEISPIAINPEGALGMHPGRGVSSWVEFKTVTLSAIELYPAVRINASCRENPQAGIVGLTVYADGKALGHRLLLDQNDRPQVRVDLNGATTLKIEVDQGNDRITCDWFSIGLAPITK